MPSFPLFFACCKKKKIVHEKQIIVLKRSNEISHQVLTSNSSYIHSGFCHSLQLNSPNGTGSFKMSQHL